MLGFGPLSSVPLSTLPTSDGGGEVSAPFNQNNWPNPRRLVAALIVTLAAAPSVAVAAPGFSQTSWPNPTRAAYSTINRTWLSPATQTIPTPFVFSGWENPRRKTPSQQPFINPSRLLLVGQDAIYGGPGQTVAFSWPNPQPKLRSRELLTWAQGKTSEPPFASVVALNPRAPSRKVGLLTWLQPKTAEAVVEAAPFAQSSWWVPKRKGLLVASSVTKEYGEGVEAPGEPPFAQTAWPNPLRKTQSNVNRSFEAHYAIDDTFPLIGRTEFTNPRINRRATAGWTQNLLESTLSGPPVPLPIGRLSDWPNPQRKGRLLTSSVTKEYGDGVEAPAAPPTRQTEWPNPQQKRFALENRFFACWYVIDDTLPLIGRGTFANPVRKRIHTAGWTQNLLASTLDIPVVVALPTGRLLEWPNPLQPRSANVGNVTSKPQYLVPATPHNQVNWPLPVRQHYARALLSLARPRFDLTLGGFTGKNVIVDGHQRLGLVERHQRGMPVSGHERIGTPKPHKRFVNVPGHNRKDDS